MQFRKDIQGLRAIAFFLVFIFHLNSPWLSGGFIGVDIFFVISGYLMTSIILFQKEKNGFGFFDFYVNRVKRIVPVYFFMLLCVCIAGSYIYLFTDIQTLKLSVKESALFISNNYFATGDSYFGAKMTENPLLHTWSLSIEMQFYFLLPLILIFVNVKYLPKVFLILIVALLAYSSYQMEYLDQKGAVYFSLMARIPEFLIGGYFGLKFKNFNSISRGRQNLLAAVSVVCIIGSAYFIDENDNFPGLLAIIPCVAAASLLTFSNNMISEFLSKKIPVYFGELSYSLYLWHWPIMAFVRYKFDDYTFSSLQMLMICGATFLMSWLSYSFIETNLRKTKPKIFYAGFGLLCILLLTSYYSIRKISIKNKIPDYYVKPVIGVASHKDGIIEKLGDMSKSDGVFMIGDSHALMIKPFLDYIGKKNHFSFETLTCDAYPAIEGIDESEIPREFLHFFKDSQKLIVKTKQKMATSKVIIVNSIGYSRIPSLETSLDKMIASHKAQKIILIRTFPGLDHNPIKMNNNFTKQNGFEYKLVNFNKNDAFLEKLEKKYDNVFIYNLSKSKIFNEAPYINDTIFYYDRDHINTYGSIKLAKDLNSDFMNFLRPLLK